MEYPYFHKDLIVSKSQRRAEDIPTLDRAQLDNPRTYIPSNDLVEAVNVALVLGMPLLLTGEPGTGKTQLASALGAAFSSPVHKFETKSTSQARDLFYSFDALAAFKAEKDTDPRRFIRYQALGRAILDAFSAKDVANLLPPASETGYDHAGPRRAVVLIDEVDKAPRDFPNDVLNEIERLYFRVPELQNAASPGADISDTRGVPKEYRPIVLLTSNSEKGLPDPFLRRCVYFDIPFPEQDQMEQIVAAHLTDLKPESLLLADALDLFYAFRDKRRTQLRKQPSTAELLNWLQIVTHREMTADSSLRAQKPLVLSTLTTLVKNADDRKEAISFIKDRWDVQDQAV